MRRLGIALAALALSGCFAVATSSGPGPGPAPGPGKSQGHGPPPHAPAHGYRAKTPQGVEVVFDTQVGVYVVINVPGSYWLDDRYYRKAPKGWLWSASFEGPWEVCVEANLPAGLRAGAAKNGKKNGRGNGGR